MAKQRKARLRGTRTATRSEQRKLLECHVQRFLGTLGSGAGIGHHAPPVLERETGGLDGIAEPPVFTNLGEQAGTHAVT